MNIIYPLVNWGISGSLSNCRSIVWNGDGVVLYLILTDAAIGCGFKFWNVASTSNLIVNESSLSLFNSRFFLCWERLSLDVINSCARIKNLGSSRGWCINCPFTKIGYSAKFGVGGLLWSCVLYSSIAEDVLRGGNTSEKLSAFVDIDVASSESAEEVLNPDVNNDNDCCLDGIDKFISDDVVDLGWACCLSRKESELPNDSIGELSLELYVLGLKWYLCLELEEVLSCSCSIFLEDLKLYLEVVGFWGICSSLFIRLESEDEIEVFFNFNLGYNVDEEVESKSGNGVFCSWGIICNLEVFIAVDGLWGDRVIKGITDSGSGIWYKGVGVIGISGRGGLSVSIKLISEFVSKNVWFCNVVGFTFCEFKLFCSELICW